MKIPTMINNESFDSPRNSNNQQQKNENILNALNALSRK